MFPLYSACADTMIQGICTHSDEKWCIIGTWVAKEVRKTVEVGYGLVDVFEFLEYSILCFYKGTNSGSLFAEYVDMFLKSKQG